MNQDASDSISLMEFLDLHEDEKRVIEGLVKEHDPLTHPFTAETRLMPTHSTFPGGFVSTGR